MMVMKISITFCFEGKCSTHLFNHLHDFMILLVLEGGNFGDHLQDPPHGLGAPLAEHLGEQRVRTTVHVSGGVRKKLTSTG